MWRVCGGNEPDFGQIQGAQDFLRRAQMTIMNGIKRAAENAKRFHLYRFDREAPGISSGIEMSFQKTCLFPDMTISKDNKFHRRQALKPHRPARVEFIGRDADLRA